MTSPSPQFDAPVPANLPDHFRLPSDWTDLNFAVALSGGADSVALLRGMLQLKQQQGGTGRLLALHVDHQLRGAESEADAQWCREECLRLSVPIEILTCQPNNTGDGIEAAARAQRYRLLTAAAERAGVRYLATAHTLDDQVETVLFRVLRGTGLRGLAGIPHTRTLTPALTLVRPLLDGSREWVIGYLAGLGQTYRNDGSNTDLQFTRNRLRHELLPLLRDRYNAELDASLVRLASQAGDAQRVVETHARKLLEATRLAAKPQAIALNCSRFAGEDTTLVREALRIAWREAGLPEQGMTFDWWKQLAELAQQSCAGQSLNLPGDVRASMDADCVLRFEVR